MPDFPCTKCGACCRVAGYVPELAHLANSDGACMHLTRENLCAIYENRPRICRVRDMQPAVLTEKAWHERNEAECNKLHLAVYGTRRVA